MGGGGGGGGVVAVFYATLYYVESCRGVDAGLERCPIMSSSPNNNCYSLCGVLLNDKK